MQVATETVAVGADCEVGVCVAVGADCEVGVCVGVTER